MDISYVKKVIKLLENSSIDEIEVEEEGRKLRVARNRNAAPPMPYQFPYPMPTIVPPGPALAVPESAPRESVATAPQKKYHEVMSPIVGTFYRAPSPDAEAYVSEGQSVKAGQVLCIVEAMKLMNEIDCDVDGTIIKIMVENGKPVEYNQVLFLIDRG